MSNLARKKTGGPWGLPCRTLCILRGEVGTIHDGACLLWHEMQRGKRLETPQNPPWQTQTSATVKKEKRSLSPLLCVKQQLLLLVKQFWGLFLGNRNNLPYLESRLFPGVWSLPDEVIITYYKYPIHIQPSVRQHLTFLESSALMDLWKVNSGLEMEAVG